MNNIWGCTMCLICNQFWIDNGHVRRVREDIMFRVKFNYRASKNYLSIQINTYTIQFVKKDDTQLQDSHTLYQGRTAEYVNHLQKYMWFETTATFGKWWIKQRNSVKMFSLETFISPVRLLLTNSYQIQNNLFSYT